MDKIFIKVARAKTGKVYFALCYDAGYRMIPLTFAVQDIAEILNVPVAEIYQRYVLRDDESVRYEGVSL